MPTIAEAVALAKARHMIKEAIDEATKPKPRTQRTCAFVRAGGERCAIVALKDHHYCYYHQHDRRDRKELRRLFNSRRELLEKQSDGAGFGLPNTGAGRAKWDELSALVFDYVDCPRSPTPPPSPPGSPTSAALWPPSRSPPPAARR